MLLSQLVLIRIPTIIVGCAHRKQDGAVVHTDSIQRLVGQRVTLTGIAENRKIGAALEGDVFYVWMDGLHQWPGDCAFSAVSNTVYRISLLGYTMNPER